MYERNYCVEETTENLRRSLRRSLHESSSNRPSSSTPSSDAESAFWLVVAAVLTIATLVMGLLT